jgi:hypothetical protein
MTTTTTAAANTPSTINPRSSADDRIDDRFQAGLRAPNIDSRAANEYVWTTSGPVPCTVTFSTSKRSCSFCHTTLAAMSASAGVAGADTLTPTSTSSLPPPRWKPTETD